MNISLLKVITTLSVLIGLACGFIALLPYLNGISIFVLVCLSSIIVISILMKLNLLKFETVPESITIGGIIGFVSSIAFLVVYVPLAVLLIKVFKYAANYGVSLALVHSNLFLIIVMSIFLAAFVATVNGLTSLGIFYICKFIDNLNNNNQQ